MSECGDNNTGNDTAFQAFFTTEHETIPDNLIKFCTIDASIGNYQIKGDGPLYYKIIPEDQIPKRSGKNKFGNLAICQQGIEKPVAYFYAWFEYLEGINQIIQDPKNLERFRMHLTYENVQADNKVKTPIELFIDRLYLLNIYDENQVPELICKILSNPKWVKDFSERQREFTMEDLVKSNQNVGSLPRLKSTFKRTPFPYQAHNIQWMTQLERRIQQDSLTCTEILETGSQKVFNIKSIDESMVYHPRDGTILDPETVDKIEVNFKGGVLADDVGLGKTMSMIGLIMERKLDYKAGAKPKPTLVVCPARLCKQWQEEIGLAGTLTSKIVGTIAQYKSLVKEGVNQYDVIITSDRLLINENYHKYINDEKNRNNRVLIASISDEPENQGVAWERIIIDEGHEHLMERNSRRAVKTDPVRAQILKINSDYRWICSGTPYRHSHDLKILIDYLSDRDNGLDGLSMENLTPFYGKVLQTVFRKNTKDSVSSQIKIPLPHIETQFLDMTEIERRIYKSAMGDRIKMIQYCNHILVSDEALSILGNNPMSLDEIHQKMSDYYKRQYEKYEKRMGKLDEQIEKLTKRKNLTASETNELQDARLKRTEANVNYRNMHARFTIFDELTTKVEESPGCPICYADLSDNSATTAITPCGHIFCLECIEEMCNQGREREQCPVCRFNFTQSEVNVVRDGPADAIEKQGDTNKWGTKMARLVDYLRTVLEGGDNRVIVFSQWDSMLKLVSKTLEECEVKHTLLNGSMHVLNGRIRRFKLDKSIRVCLLSSDKSPSGLNLTEANHIVLLDTFDTDRDSARTIEEQAIGRAVRIGQQNKVKVKRLVMLNSIEHDFYLNNIGADVNIAGNEEDEGDESEIDSDDDMIVDSDNELDMGELICD